MTNIQDLVVPTKGTGKYLNVTVLNFPITPTNGVALYWQVFAETTVTDPETQEEVAQPGAMLLEGNLQFPQSEYDTWGTDDSVVVNWIMNDLGLSAVSTE